MSRPPGITTTGVVVGAKEPGVSYRNEPKTGNGLVCHFCGRTFHRLRDYSIHQGIVPDEGYRCASPKQLRKAGYTRDKFGTWHAPAQATDEGGGPVSLARDGTGVEGPTGTVPASDGTGDGGGVLR